MALQVFILLAIAVVTIAIAVEVRSWTGGTRLVTRWQKGYRIAAALTMDAVLLMVFFDSAIRAAHNTWLELSYWGAAIVLAFLTVLIVLLDLRAGLSSYQQRRREAFKDVFGEERQDK